MSINHRTRIGVVLLVMSMAPVLIAQDARNEDKKNQNHDPGKANLVISDIANFWRAYDLAKTAATVDDRQAIYQREYFDQASAGLQFFQLTKIGRIDHFVSTIDKRPHYYASLRALTSKIPSYRERMRKSLRNMQSLYPDSSFPDMYFVIGRMNSAGTASDKGLMIGVDMFGRTNSWDESELTDWHKQALLKIDELPGIVAHELIHFQQSYRFTSRSLLEMSIAEGSCDFLGQMISGQMINRHLHRYGNPREREIWRQFEPAMNGTNLSQWLYNGNKGTERPGDLGYYVGYKICESYYKHAKNKKQAIKEILQINDFAQFLHDSRYSEKFK